MRFICPDCETVYNLPDNALKPSQKVRCCVCHHVLNQDGTLSLETDVTPLQKDAPPLETKFNPVPEPEFENIPEPEFEIEQQPEPDLESASEPEPESNAENEDQVFQEIKDSFNFNADSEEQEPFLLDPAFKPSVATPAGYLKWVRPLYFLSIAFLFASIYLLFFYQVPNIPIIFKDVTYTFTEKDYKRYLFVQGDLENQGLEDAEINSFKISFLDSENRVLSTADFPSSLQQLPSGQTDSFELNIERPPAHAVKVTVQLSSVVMRPGKVISATKPAIATPPSPQLIEGDEQPQNDPL